MHGFLKRIRKIRLEARELKSVPSVGCEVKGLLSTKEVDLEKVFSSKWIEAAHRGVARRAGCNDRAAHQLVLHDSMEVSGRTRRVGNVVGVGP